MKRKIYSNNKSGVAGVYWHRDGGWVARIKRNNTLTYLGWFGEFDEAVAARRKAEANDCVYRA